MRSLPRVNLTSSVIGVSLLAQPGIDQRLSACYCARRRHAAVLAGHRLAPGLVLLRCRSNPAVLRGLESVERDWAARVPVPGRAAMFDTELDLPGQPSLEEAAHIAGIEPGPG